MTKQKNQSATIKKVLKYIGKHKYLLPVSIFLEYTAYTEIPSTRDTASHSLSEIKLVPIINSLRSLITE